MASQSCSTLEVADSAEDRWKENLAGGEEMLEIEDVRTSLTESELGVDPVLYNAILREEEPALRERMRFRSEDDMRYVYE